MDSKIKGKPSKLFKTKNTYGKMDQNQGKIS